MAIFITLSIVITIAIIFGLETCKKQQQILPRPKKACKPFSIRS